MSDIDPLVAGRDAWERICRRGEKTFEDWIAVGHALAIGRAECLKAAGTNRPFGKRYTAAMRLWLDQNGLGEMIQQERYWILRVIDRLAEIEAFRAGLDAAANRRFNHPQSIWDNWKRSQGGTPSSGRARTGPRRTGHNKSVFWPQDMLRRGGDAMRESRSSDYYTLARICLHAAIRTVDDLDLLETPAKRRQASMPAHAAA